MHLNAKPPIFVPFSERAEIEKLSKAALMDMVWDYARQVAWVCGEDDTAEIMAEFRKRREIILTYRNRG
jgi:hypothetical protein